MSGLLYTEGVQWLAENAGAYWLIDVVGSYQPQCRKDKWLSDFQSWTLTVNQENHQAVVKCERDAGDRKPIIQNIEYSDFPLPHDPSNATPSPGS